MLIMRVFVRRINPIRLSKWVAFGDTSMISV